MAWNTQWNTSKRASKVLYFFLPHSEQLGSPGKRSEFHKLKNYKPREETNHHEGESRHKNKWKLANPSLEHNKYETIFERIKQNFWEWKS